MSRTRANWLNRPALRHIGRLYDVEREVHDLLPDERQRIRQEKAKPIADALHGWMLAQRRLVHEGTAIAKALDYSLKGWTALVRYLDDGMVAIDNNWCENQIRPWAMAVRTGCSPARCAAANVRLRS